MKTNEKLFQALINFHDLKIIFRRKIKVNYILHQLEGIESSLHLTSVHLYVNKTYKP